MISIRHVDYRCRTDAVAWKQMLREYAADPAIDGRGLSAAVLDQCIVDLVRMPHAVSFLAWDSPATGASVPVGLANCFETYSTFKAGPVVNIHDFMVTRRCRGRGIGKCLMNGIVDWASSRSAVKVTLEVYRGNTAAAGLYAAMGFGPPEGNRDLGETLFLSRPLR